MQIKVERFLTLTAMLASTQVGLVGCGDDGSSPEPTNSADAGNTADAGETSEGNPTSASSITSDDTADLNATLANPDAGTSSEAAATDGGASSAASSETLSVASDGGGETSSATGAATWTDAGGEVWPDTTAEVWPDTTAEVWPDTTAEVWPDTTAEVWPDTTAEVWPDTTAEVWPDTSGETPWSDAGAPACVADAADEGAVIVCAEAFGGCNYETYAATACYNTAATNTASYFDVFWDCYTNQNVEDPCGEAADYAASACQSFAMENTCMDDVLECETLADDCAEVTVESCKVTLGHYNTQYRASVQYCAAEKLAAQAGPDYEGCGYDFYNCMADPYAE